MSVQKKLLEVQSKLKANKGQYNSFGKYHYRSAEDIVESAKPLLKENGLLMTIQDDLVVIGDRYYVKAIVTVGDIETGESIITTAFAREEENKKGMDGSQVTGAASSYARKYAMNGMFAIDDTKDADTNEHKNVQNSANAKSNSPQKVSTAKPTTTKSTTKKPTQNQKSTSDSELKEIIAKIDTLAREKVSVDKDAVIKAVSEHNGGSPDYKKLESVEEGKKIVAELEKIK